MDRSRAGGVRRRRSLRALAPAGALVIALLLPSAAAAHAELVSSTPAAGEVLTNPPTEVVLTFDEAAVGNSTFDVVDSGGTTVASGAPDPAEATIMRATLPALGPGVYEVRWTSVAEDTDVAHGTFQFTIAEATPPPATPTPASSESPSAEPTSTAAPTATAVPTGAGDGISGAGTDVLVPIAVVALLIGVGAAYFLRRRGPA
jgi:methionine-rich copper-binding protein CopC